MIRGPRGSSALVRREVDRTDTIQFASYLRLTVLKARTTLERVILAAALLVAAASMILYLGLTAFRYSGDAVIHLVFAERLAEGHPFEFNAGIPCSGTTSFAWNAYEAAWMKGLGPSHALLFISLTCLVALFATAGLVSWTARRLGATRGVSFAAGLCFAALPGTVYNAPLGMEAAAFAFVSLAVFAVALLTVSRRPAALVGYAALAALATALRPEGVVAMAVLLITTLWRRDLKLLVAGIIGSLLLAAPIAILQHRMTGAWLPESGLARMAAARRDHWTIHLLGPVYFYGRPFLRVLSAWPILAAAAHFRLLKGWSAIASVAGALILYGFVVGATDTGRYFVWVWALAIPGAAAAAQRAWFASGRQRAGVLIGITWLSISAIGETAQRLKTGTRIGYGITELRTAFDRRDTATHRFLAGRPMARGGSKVRVAFYEVQQRWYLNDDVEVLSLDGRTSRAAEPLRFDASGCPNLTDLLRQATIVGEWPEDKMPSCRFGRAWDAAYESAHGQVALIPRWTH